MPKTIAKQPAEFHRTRKRIRDLGEVFTPEQYVEDMLDLLGTRISALWSDLDTVFFEPCCGHGNIVVPILKRRIIPIYKKGKAQRKKQPALYAVANAIDTLWAIDIDSQNVNECRGRVWAYCMQFILENTTAQSINELLDKHFEYFAHLLCAIKWHIFENETLSALSNADNAKVNANKTKLGAKWFKNNGHHPINFNETWCEFYRECDKKKLIPIEYQKAEQFLLCLLENNRLSSGFEFATEYLHVSKKQIILTLGES